MSIEEYSIEELAEKKKKAKKCARAHTIVYCILFQFTMSFMCLTHAVFQDIRSSSWINIIEALSISSIPISIPLSIYLMWSRYERGQYAKVHSYAFIPIGTFAATILIVLSVSLI